MVHRGRRAGLLSGGEQQMLAVGRALARKPKILLLDELSLGLAPVIVERLLPVVRRYAEDAKCAVLLVEQHIQLALQVADRGYVLAHGEVVLAGRRMKLRSETRQLVASYLGTGERRPMTSESFAVEETLYIGGGWRTGKGRHRSTSFDPADRARAGRCAERHGLAGARGARGGPQGSAGWARTPVGAAGRHLRAMADLIRAAPADPRRPHRQRGRQAAGGGRGRGRIRRGLPELQRRVGSSARGRDPAW